MLRTQFREWRIVLTNCLVAWLSIVIFAQPAIPAEQETSGPWGGPIRPPSLTRSLNGSQRNGTITETQRATRGTRESTRLSGSQIQLLPLKDTPLEVVSSATGEVRWLYHFDHGQVVSSSQKFVSRPTFEMLEETGVIFGLWRIKADQYCITWLSMKEGCYDLDQLRDNTFLLVDGKGDEVARWRLLEAL